MRKRRRLWSAAAALGIGSTAFGAAFTWTAGGDGEDWDDWQNWSASCFQCYPSTTNDDATIDDDCNPCTIDFVTGAIDDLTLQEVSVTFDGEGTKKLLSVDMFSAGGAATNTSLTLTNRAMLTNITP